jgi:hypothetical protein
MSWRRFKAITLLFPGTIFKLAQVQFEFLRATADEDGDYCFAVAL